MRDYPKKKTVDLCHYKESSGCPCNEKVLWKLKGEKHGHIFKVCDVHLAWGIRLSGAPALVEEFAADVDAT